MGEKELVLELGELTNVTFQCKHKGCGASMTFKAGGAAGAVEIICPGCGQPYPQIRGALSAFREFLKIADGIGGIDTRITIRAAALGDQSKS
jgi:hypothetical protein